MFHRIGLAPLGTSFHDGHEFDQLNNTFFADDENQAYSQLCAVGYKNITSFAGFVPSCLKRWVKLEITGRTLGDMSVYVQYGKSC
ncbi:MAG TPA: hypothetical protein VHA33_17410 [Candidatus Angelobacter sp.]|jgi:hypothetical protein|nr:hypothetical protein [Candidatus Angelobacter sp.]